MNWHSRCAVLLVACVAFQLLIAVSGNCQAWVSPKGTGSLSISYINELDTTDYFGKGENYVDVPPNPAAPNGTRLTDFGELRTQGMYLDFAYSFTDKFALTLSLPYLAPKWTAPTSTTAEGVPSSILSAHRFADGSIPLDDGHYHGSFQNVAFRVRYNITSHPFLITPYIQYNQPATDYLFYSHAIVGDHLRTLGLGTYLGGTLGDALPNAYLQGNYSLSFVQRANLPAGYEQFETRRYFNQFELEFGYFFIPALRAFTVLSAQVTSGGLNGPHDFGPPDPNNPLFYYHTQLSRNNYLNIGVGGQYSLNDRMDVYGLVSHMITARNLHGLTYGFTFGVSWGFGGSPQRPCHC